MQAGTEDRDQQDGKQHRRKRHPDIHQPRNQRINKCAEKAGKKAEQRPDQASKPGGNESDRERDARTEDHPRKYIASKPVGAEQISRLGIGKADGRYSRNQQVLGQRILGGDQRRRNSENDQQNNEAARANDFWVPRQARDNGGRLRAAILTLLSQLLVSSVPLLCRFRLSHAAVVD